MTKQPTPTPILSDDEAASRLWLLAELQAALGDLGIRCVLARNRKLVLRDNGPYKPSGLTDPQLHIFLPDRSQQVTTDGANYRISDQEFPVGNPAAAATAICATQLAPS